MTILFTTNDDVSVQHLASKLSELNARYKDRQVQQLIEIKENRPIRSNDQNRYYWAILKEIGATSGYESDELHKMYGKKFIGHYVLDELVARSTKDLDSREMTVYINQVKEHAKSFYNCTFPELKDKDYLKWESESRERYEDIFAAI